MEISPQERIVELKQKIQGLNIIIHEAQEATAFRDHGFYPILDRTLKALKLGYEADAHKAAKSNLTNIFNFLGRMEMINDFYDILDRFSTNADQAQLEIDACEEEIKQLNQQMMDDAREPDLVDSGGSMG